MVVSYVQYFRKLKPHPTFTEEIENAHFCWCYQYFFWKLSNFYFIFSGLHDTVNTYSLRSYLIDSDLVQSCTKSESIK
jgi:hypothetical protein